MDNSILLKYIDLLDSFKLKKKTDIALAVIWGLCCIANVAIYILDIIG